MTLDNKMPAQINWHKTKFDNHIQNHNCSDDAAAGPNTPITYSVRFFSHFFFQSFYLSCVTCRHCKFVCEWVDSLNLDTVQMNVGFCFNLLCFTPLFVHLFALHHFLPLLFGNFRFSIHSITVHSWPNNVSASAMHAFHTPNVQLNGMLIHFAAAFFFFSLVCVMNILEVFRRSNVCVCVYSRVT